ncbi:MAG: hypothetical protein WAV26_06025 [Candidatus Deferrimicrobium sp.]
MELFSRKKRRGRTGKRIPPVLLAGLLLGGIALGSAAAFGGISFRSVKALNTGTASRQAPSGYTPWPVVSFSDLVENGAYARFLNVGHGKVFLRTLGEMGGYTSSSDGRVPFVTRTLPVDEAPSYRFASRGSGEWSGELPPIASRNGGERDDAPGSSWMPVHDGGGVATVSEGKGDHKLGGGCPPPPDSIPIPGAGVLFASGLAALAGLGRSRLFA